MDDFSVHVQPPVICDQLLSQRKVDQKQMFCDGVTKMAEIRVLLVEDEPMLRELMIFALDEIGANVTAVDSAQGAAEILANQAWSLLITDVQTPGPIDGWDLAWKAFNTWPELPIVVTSGYTSRAQDLLPPPAVFISKPWGLDQFLNVVGERISHS